MRLNHFFVTPQSIQGRTARIDDRVIAKQIARVLRLQLGDEVLLLDGDGFEYVGKLSNVSAQEVVCEIVRRQQNTSEPALKITLYQALLKKDNIEWVAQKCTEVGVTAFAPIVTERSEKLQLNVERMKKIIREAAEQSGRGIIPELAEPQLLTDALRCVCRAEVPNVILHREGDAIKNVAHGTMRYAANIFVGPEGGWSDSEFEEFRCRENDSTAPAKFGRSEK
jgi:16S rRNA (uracil1498-N3)-methyltransferase